MIVFTRSYIRAFDGKLSKYWNVLESRGLHLHYVGWSRGKPISGDTSNDTYYNRPAELGGGWRSIIKIIQWNIFLFCFLFKNKSKIKLIHAIDFDTVIPVYIFCILTGKPFIFDIYDKYSSLRNFPNILKKIIDIVEKKIIKKSNLSIIADSCRFQQHGLTDDEENIIVLENIPSIKLDQIPEHNIKNPIKLGYFGVLEKDHRGLENLTQACQNRNDIELHIVGYGPLEDYFKAKSLESENIKYFGPKSAFEGLKIMSHTDILIGMYYLSVPNHKYAAPNKYFEHLYLGRPLLTTLGTPTGAKVEKHETGWVIGESVSDIKDWLDHINPEEIMKKGEKANLLWDKKYKNYYAENYESIYADIVIKAIRPNA
ncbi:hypothetical protein [Alcaligenes faecalis]|uniref:hypothetical protein n=1 Tax=Alcaligenes aquatilis TaxID=323284 RepID=UPI002AA6771C|nr:hypothetical protein [Alcaligenes faecalis]